MRLCYLLFAYAGHTLPSPPPPLAGAFLLFPFYAAHTGLRHPPGLEEWIHELPPTRPVEGDPWLLPEISTWYRQACSFRFNKSMNLLPIAMWERILHLIMIFFFFYSAEILYSKFCYSWRHSQWEPHVSKWNPAHIHNVDLIKWTAWGFCIIHLAFLLAVTFFFMKVRFLCSTTFTVMFWNFFIVCEMFLKFHTFTFHKPLFGVRIWCSIFLYRKKNHCNIS